MRNQIVWRWTAKHAPKGEAIRWHFIAHGAPFDPGKETDNMAALLKSHGKMVRLLPCP